MLPDQQRHIRWIVWGSFAVFCVLVSNSWWLLSSTANGPPSIPKQSCFYSVTGLVALAISYRPLWDRLRKRQLVCLRLAAVSILLFGLPAAVGEWTRSGVPDESQVALFALAPFVVVAVAMSHQPLAGEEFGIRRFFVPALAGFGGALFLLSFRFPVSLREWTMFGAVLVAVVVVSFASVWIYRLLREFAIGEAVAVVCLSNAVFLSLRALFAEESWSGALSLLSLSSLYNLLELVLLVWLFRELSPVRLAARFLVVPLLLILEGLVILRPALTPRIGAGLVLMLCSAGYILFSRRQNSDAALSIR